MKKILANILPRLVNRFSLRATGDVEDLSLSEVVSPVTSIDDLLDTIRITRNTMNIAATGWNTGYTQPAGKRTTVKIIEVILDTGNYTHNAIEIYDPVTGWVMGIANYAATSGEVVRLEQPIVLIPGWEVKVHVNAYTSAGDLLLKMLVSDRDAY